MCFSKSYLMHSSTLRWLTTGRPLYKSVVQQRVCPRRTLQTRSPSYPNAGSESTLAFPQTRSKPSSRFLSVHETALVKGKIHPFPSLRLSDW